MKDGRPVQNVVFVIPGGEGFHGYSSPIGQSDLDGFRLRTAV